MPASILRPIAAGIAGLCLSACLFDESRLNLAITATSPTAATKVWLQFTGIEMKPRDEEALTITFTAAKGFDLLTLRDGDVAMLLEDEKVPAGRYEWIRLLVDPAAGSSYVVDGTGQRALRIPEGAGAGLELQLPSKLPYGLRADFTIDVLLDRSLIPPSGQSAEYLMKPVLRITDNLQSGTVDGAYAASNPAFCAGKAPRIYLFPGSVAPDDLFNPLGGGSDSSPSVDSLVTAGSTRNSAFQYEFRIPYVPPGTYTLGFTCAADDPAVDESIAWGVYTQPVVVISGQTTTASF